MPPLSHRRDGLSVTQAAAQLGVHPMTIRNWIRDGVLPVTRFPHGHSPTRLVREVIRIHPADLEHVARERDAGRFSAGSENESAQP